MAQIFKVLGQSKPLATTLTALYTVPAATSAVASSIVVCNQGAATTFRVSVAIAGAVDTPAQYLFFDTAVGVNTTYTATIGMTLATTDVVRVYNTLATCSFVLFGSEIT
jgi:hypothetical protein